MQIYAQILVILACTALAQLPPSFHAFSTTITPLSLQRRGRGDFFSPIFAILPPSPFARNARGGRKVIKRGWPPGGLKDPCFFGHGFDDRALSRWKRLRRSPSRPTVASLCSRVESSRVEGSFFLSFFFVSKGKGDEGLLIFVGRECFFPFFLRNVFEREMDGWIGFVGFFWRIFRLEFIYIIPFDWYYFLEIV